MVVLLLDAYINVDFETVIYNSSIKEVGKG